MQIKFQTTTNHSNSYCRGCKSGLQNRPRKKISPSSDKVVKIQIFLKTLAQKSGYCERKFNETKIHTNCFCCEILKDLLDSVSFVISFSSTGSMSHKVTKSIRINSLIVNFHFNFSSQV